VDKQKAKKAIIFGAQGVVKMRLDEVKEIRGAVTGRAYFWHKPGMALKMDKRDHAAAFPPEKLARATKKREVKDGESTNA